MMCPESPYELLDPLFLTDSFRYRISPHAAPCLPVLAWNVDGKNMSDPAATPESFSLANVYPEF